MSRTTRLTALADAVLMPCFDGTTAPEWLLRRVHESIGAVCLFARNIGTPDDVRALTDALRAARPDVVIAIDEEAGDVTRLDAATGSPFPGNAALGRVDDVRLTRSVGYQVGMRLRNAGVNLNFAPCADVASDPANPVIGARSFGNDPTLVARHTSAFIAGQQAAGVGACAKHFPGHGDTDADTHHRLAVLDGDLERLLADAIPPFTAAIGAGVASVMAGHLLVPAVDRQPASVSHRWLTDILRGELGFQGVIATDALEMEALAGEYGIAESAVLALIAGADLLCLGGETRPEEELSGISSAIADAVAQGRLSEERLADAARRVGELNGRLAAAESTAVPGDNGDADVSATVARRALDIAGPLPSWTEPALVLRCDDRPNIAVGHVPWGPSAVRNGTTDHVLHATSVLPAREIGAAATVLLVTRDRHRHPWMVDTLTAVRALRPDAVVLEMGTTGVGGAQAPAIGSYGATLANTRAALDVLGVPVTEIPANGTQ